MAATPGHAAEKEKVHKANIRTHHIAFQVDQNDKAVMNLVLNNVANMMQYYQDKGETADIEVVAYGPGLMMLRDDKSPVKGRLASLKKVAFPSKLTFSACHNTMTKMEKKEGHAIPIVSEARIVPGWRGAPDRAAGTRLDLYPAVSEPNPASQQGRLR